MKNWIVNIKKCLKIIKTLALMFDTFERSRTKKAGQNYVL